MKRLMTAGLCLMFLGLALASPAFSQSSQTFYVKAKMSPDNENPSNRRVQCDGVGAGARYCEPGCGWNHYFRGCNLRRVVPIRTAGHFDWLPYSRWSRWSQRTRCDQF